MLRIFRRPAQWAAALGDSRHARALAIAGGLSLLLLLVALVVLSPLLLVPLGVLLGVVVHVVGRSGWGGEIARMERLRQAEGSLAAAPTTEAAARELAEHAIALLDAPSAVVLIEGIGDTVRVGLGDATGQKVYGDGSRMRLLNDDGVPCGSIAVSGRRNGKPYSDLDERILDALAERVSSTLHRLSLFGEIREERRTLQDVLTSSSDGIFSVGPDHRVRSWNPAMSRITGVPTNKALGEQSAAVFRPIDETGANRYGASDPGRAPEPTEALLVSITPASGDEKRWLTCSWSPLSGGGYVVVARDETERKKIQDDKDGWIAQVSHELRTPLTPLKGFLHTLAHRDEQFTAEDRAKIYEVMLREQQRLEDLVESLLQTTDLEVEDDLVVTEVVDWAGVVVEQAESIARRDLTRDVEVRLADGLPAVVADPQLAARVLHNLLTNALKYGGEGTPIRITVGHRGGDVITTVADAGPGVPVDDRERVFDKFTRLGDHLTRPQQGVGLGLYIARRSVERLGGEIWIDEAEGGGAAFSFTLPAHEADRPAERTIDLDEASSERSDQVR